MDVLDLHYFTSWKKSLKFYAVWGCHLPSAHLGPFQVLSCGAVQASHFAVCAVLSTSIYPDRKWIPVYCSLLSKPSAISSTRASSRENNWVASNITPGYAFGKIVILKVIAREWYVQLLTSQHLFFVEVGFLFSLLFLGVLSLLSGTSRWFFFSSLILFFL